MYFSTLSFLLVIGSVAYASPFIGQHLQSRDIGFTCELTSRVTQTPVVQPICVSAGDCPYVAFSSSSGLATGCASADQCCARFRCTTSSGRSGVCKSSGGCGASSSCPRGSGCCPTSRTDASEGDETGTTVAFNPDDTFDEQGTGENEIENSGEEFGNEEISEIPFEEEVSELPSEEEISEVPSDELGEFGEEFEA